MSFAPTHAAPQGGMEAWATADASQPPVATIDPGVPMEVTEWSGAWAHILCENGWTAWVDGRLLLPAPATPAPAAPTSATAARRRPALPVDGCIGAAFAVAAIFFPWVRAAGIDPVNATDLPVGVLVDSLRGFDLALLVVPLALALCVPRPGARLAAAAALASVAGLFVLQVDPKGLLGPGVLVVLAGAAAGAPFQLRQGTPGS